MEENDVPRRLKRFYRKGEQVPMEARGESRERTIRTVEKAPEKEDSGLEKIASEDLIEREYIQKRENISKKKAISLEKSIEEVPSEDEISDSLAKQASDDKKDRAKEIAVEEIERFKDRHKRLPMRTEYDQLVENIFSQIQDEERKNKGAVEEEKKKGLEEKHLERKDRRKDRKRRGEEEEEKKTDEKPPEENTTTTTIQGLDIKEILNLDTESGGKGGEDEFDLSKDLDIESGGEEDFKITPIEDEKTVQCDNCKKRVERKFFCPDCGTQFCEKCAKKVAKVGDKLEVECPSCGKKMKK